MAQGISMSMKNYRSTIRKSPSETRLSNTRTVVVTVEPLLRQSERPSALRGKGGIGIWSIFKFCIFGLAQSTGMVPCNVTYVSLFIAHMSPGGWEYFLKYPVLRLEKLFSIATSSAGIKYKNMVNIYIVID